MLIKIKIFFFRKLFKKKCINDNINKNLKKIESLIDVTNTKTFKIPQLL